MSVCLYVNMYMYVYVCIWMYMYVNACICMYMYVYVCICMYMYVYVCICMYMHVYVCICHVYVCICHVCVCMYVCMYVSNAITAVKIPTTWKKSASFYTIAVSITLGLTQLKLLWGWDCHEVCWEVEPATSCKLSYLVFVHFA